MGVVVLMSVNNVVVVGVWILVLVFGLLGDLVMVMVVGVFSVYNI